MSRLTDHVDQLLGDEIRLDIGIESPGLDQGLPRRDRGRQNRGPRGFRPRRRGPVPLTLFTC